MKDSFADKIDRWEVVETSDGAFQGEVPVKSGIWQAEVVDAEAYLGGKIQEAHYHADVEADRMGSMNVCMYVCM